MADANVSITQGVGTSVDTRTVGGEHRQVVVVGDPDTNSNVADVLNEDPGSSSSLQGLVVRLAGSATVVGLQGTTARPFLMNSDGAIKVYDVVNGTLTTVTGLDRVRNLVDGTISSGTLDYVTRVRNLIDGTISSGTLDYVTRVRNILDGTLSTITGIDRVRNIVDGTISLANIQATAVVAAAGGSVAGSTSGVSTSGVTIVSPEASRNIKVYAFSLTTTAQVHNQIRFTNGSGASPTTLWQVGLQAPSQGIAGANLAISPPGYLFAAGSGNTLALVKDTASLVHYSVSYFKESA